MTTIVVILAGSDTIDYNAEAQFYGTASSNRAELTLPWATVVLDYVAAAQNESAYFQCPSGLHYPGALGPFGYYNLSVIHWLPGHLGSLSSCDLILLVGVLLLWCVAIGCICTLTDRLRLCLWYGIGSKKLFR